MIQFTDFEIGFLLDAVTEHLERKCCICQQPCEPSRYIIRTNRICTKCAMDLRRPFELAAERKPA